MNRASISSQPPINEDYNIADTTPQPGTAPKNIHNLRRMTLYTYRSMFLIKPDKSMGITKHLWIDRNTGRPTELPDTEEVPPEYNLMKEFSALLGVIVILNKAFLMFVNEVLPICQMGEHMIYTVSSISFIPFESKIPESEQKVLMNYFVDIRKLLSQGYYFSPTYDLTLSKIKALKKRPRETRFQWNHALYKDFLRFNIDAGWQVSLIQGYIGHFSATIEDKKLTYYLISRRSCLNAGTRYFSRGIDDDANVANFVETEQIVYYKDYCCSHVQVRGSVPVFWKQKGMKANIRLLRNYDLTNHVFLDHINYLNETYGKVICINLMAKAKEEEQMITSAFESHMRGNALHEVGYEYFDFHHATRNQKFENVNVLVYKIQPALDSFSFSVENTAEDLLELQQIGVIRTNCLDCLDRTNFIQGKVAIAVLDLMMVRMGVNLANLFGQELFEELDNGDIKNQHPLVVGFKNMWADNGDFLSMHYTGTGSVISDVTRVGKRNFFGVLDHGMKSINRFYNGNFDDKLKQDCIDFLLGKTILQVNPINEAFEFEIRSREKEFSIYSRVSVYIVTWNLGGYVIDQNLDLQQLFDFRNNPTPDLVIVGLQELVELKATSLMSNQEKENMILWRNKLLSTLKKIDNYIFVTDVCLFGLGQLVFAKQTFSKRIFKVETDKVKTGLAGALGNKGAVVVKCHVDDTSFCFVNCHLEPSAKNVEQRLNSLLEIHKKAFQQEGVGKRKKERIMHLDNRFLFGDVNFRINAGNEVKTAIKNYIFLKSLNQDEKALDGLRTLQQFDQLNLNKTTDHVLQRYQEGPVNFLPTYKYDLGTDVYDTSKKQRAPAWTDRILWGNPSLETEQIFYDRVEYQVSDHRPVVSYFTAQAKLIDKVKKEEVAKKVYDVEDVVIKVEPEKIKIEETKLEEGERNILETETTQITISKDSDSQLSFQEENSVNKEIKPEDPNLGSDVAEVVQIK